MWCDSGSSDLESRLCDYIDYFEGTCEFCIDNLGISGYYNEIKKLLEDNPERLSDRELMLANYVYGVILYKMGKLDEAYSSWLMADKYALREDDENFRAKISSYVSIYYYVKNDLVSSNRLFKDVVKRFEEQKNYTELALHYINILWYKRYEKDKSNVNDYLDKAFYYVQLSDDRRNARVYLHLGYIYKTIFNDFIRGLKHLTTARNLCYSNGNVEMESMTLHVLADGYMHLFHFRDAIDIYKQLLEDSRYRNISASLKCMILSNVSSCYLYVGDFAGATSSIGKMRDNIDETLTKVREQFEAVYDWLNAKLLICKNERLGQAEVLLNTAKDKYTANKEGFCVDQFDYLLCDTYAEYFLALEENENALMCAKDLVTLAQSYDKPTLKRAYSRLAECYEACGMYEEALKSRKLETGSLREIEDSNLADKYDELFKEFLKYTQQQRLESLAKEAKNLSKTAFIDELTGAYNKLYYQNMTDMWNDGIRVDASAIIADIDFFKQYNDLYGHQEGDKALEQVAGCIRSTVSGLNADVIRYGGEEFLIVLKEKDALRAPEVARGIVNSVYALNIKHEGSDIAPCVTISAGYYCDENSILKSLTGLVDLADKALYRAKNSGRNKAEG